MSNDQHVDNAAAYDEAQRAFHERMDSEEMSAVKARIIELLAEAVASVMPEVNETLAKNGAFLNAVEVFQLPTLEGGTAIDCNITLHRLEVALAHAIPSSPSSLQ